MLIPGSHYGDALFLGGALCLYVSGRVLKPLIAIGYPLLKTCVTLKAKPEESQQQKYIQELRNLNKYWVVLGLFTISETFVDVVLPYIFPFYHQGKLVFLLALQSKYNDRPVYVYIYDMYLTDIADEIYPFLKKVSGHMIESAMYKVREYRDEYVKKTMDTMTGMTFWFPSPKCE